MEKTNTSNKLTLLPKQATITPPFTLTRLGIYSFALAICLTLAQFLCLKFLPDTWGNFLLRHLFVQFASILPLFIFLCQGKIKPARTWRRPAYLSLVLALLAGVTVVIAASGLNSFLIFVLNKTSLSSLLQNINQDEFNLSFYYSSLGSVQFFALTVFICFILQTLIQQVCFNAVLHAGLSHFLRRRTVLALSSLLFALLCAPKSLFLVYFCFFALTLWLSNKCKSLFLAFALHFSALLTQYFALPALPSLRLLLPQYTLGFAQSKLLVPAWRLSLLAVLLTVTLTLFISYSKRKTPLSESDDILNDLTLKSWPPLAFALALLLATVRIFL